MLLSSWLKRISDRIRTRRYKPDRKPKKPDRFTQLGLTRLEDRIVLDAAFAYDMGLNTLTLDTFDAGESLDISSDGTNFIFTLRPGESWVGADGAVATSTGGTNSLTVTSATLSSAGTLDLDLSNQAVVTQTDTMGLQVANLNVTNGTTFVLNDADNDFDSIAIASTGNVELQDSDSIAVTSINSSGGTVSVTAAGAVSVNGDVSGSGDVTITAIDAATADEDVTIAAGVTVQSTAGSIQVDAGDDFTLSGTAALTANSAGQSVTLNIDSGDADTGMGGTANLQGGTITSNTTASVNGAGDGDTFNVTGTTAADLVGGGGSDVFNIDATLNGAINGEGGNDTLEGSGSGDTYVITGANAGTANGSTFTNVDHVDGAGGNDTVTGLATADSFTVTGANAFDSSTMNFSNIESVAGGGGVDSVIGTAGNDAIQIDAASAVTLASLAFTAVTDIDGAGGNDELQGLDGGQTYAVNATNGGTVGGLTFQNMETLTGGTGSDAFNLSGGGSVQQINGGDGDDRVTVTLGTTVTTQNVSFDGGSGGESGGDDLIVIGDGAAGNDTALYTPTAAGAGTVAVDQNTGGTDFTITFSGLEPVDLTDMLSVTINGSANTDTIALTNGTSLGSEDAIQVSGTVDGFTMETAFVRDVGTLTVSTAAGNDSITINSATNAHNVANLTLNTGTDTDSIAIAGSATVTGTMILTTTGSIADSGAGGTLSAGSLKLDSGTGVGTSGAVIDTTVTTLAAQASTSGGVFITETDGLTIGTVDSLSGLTTANGAVTLVSTIGDITVDQNITAGDVSNDDEFDVIIQAEGTATFINQIVLNATVQADDDADIRVSKNIRQALATNFIIADTLRLEAGGDIGTSMAVGGAAAIDVRVNTLSAHAGLSETNINNINVNQNSGASGTLTIGNASDLIGSGTGAGVSIGTTNSTRGDVVLTTEAHSLMISAAVSSDDAAESNVIL
ncbi:MAG: beta strand repeat-containing protein, partial [Planctomycetales bacterium]